MKKTIISKKNNINNKEKMATYNILAKFTAESDIKREDAERFMKEALKNIATGVQVSFVDITKSEEEEEIGGG
jgi:hypothetical protein